MTDVERPTLLVRSTKCLKMGDASYDIVFFVAWPWASKNKRITKKIKFSTYSFMYEFEERGKLMRMVVGHDLINGDACVGDAATSTCQT